MLFKKGVALGCSVTALALMFATTDVQAGEKLTGRIKIDGSSTVAPITMATAELFQQEHPKVRVTVGISGTGGGFKKFLDQSHDLRTDISDASRAIKQKEIERAENLGVSYIEIPIGIDGIAVMVHPSNAFCDYLTVDELKRIWEPGSAITSWRQVRPGFPDLPLKLYGPDTDSGTFDYFTKAIVGKERASRSDYTGSASDNVLVQGIAGDPGALGYFGYSYYEANKSKLKLVGVDNNNGEPIKPSLDIIRGGTYEPLSRPMFLYVNTEAYSRPEVKAFLQFFHENAPRIVEHPTVNYVALSPAIYEMNMNRLRSGKTGSAMAAAKAAGEKLDLAETFRRY
ncbi:MAG: PstS family phosphate ABC transporter substrate-binding protein [Phycisphaerae bacterium]|jgi:phosphate transport system substrate-binding protein